MEILVRFVKAGEETELCFESSFPNVLNVIFQKKDTYSLGNMLCRLGTKRRGGFKWEAKVKAPWGDFVFKVQGKVFKGTPRLEFEYTMPHYKFKAVSDCMSVYEDFSFEGLLQFGTELKELEDGKSATLYSCPPLSENPFNN